MSTRPYFGTTFNRANFALFMEIDPDGVEAEAIARGSDSGLAGKIRRLNLRLAAAAERALLDAAALAEAEAAAQAAVTPALEVEDAGV